MIYFRVNFFRAFVLLTLLVSINDSKAQESTSLEHILKIVHERFPLLVGAEQDVDRAEGEKRSALGEFDVKWKTVSSVVPQGYYETSRVDSVLEKPTSLWGLNLYGGYRRGSDDFADYNGKYETLPGGEFRAGFQLPIFRDREIDERRAGLKLAELGVNVAEIGVEAKRIEVSNKARQRYWYWVATGRKYVVIEELLALAKERLKGIEERVSHGDLAEFELKDNNRGILQRENQLVKAGRAFQNASIELGVFIGEDNDILLRSKVPKVMSPLGPKEVFSKSELIESASRKRPELRAINILQEQLKTELKLANNQTDPKIDFMFEWSNDVGDGDKTREPTEIESGVLLEVPLQVRKAEGKIASLEAKLRKLEQELKFFNRRIEADINDALSAMKNAREQIVIVRQELRYAKELEAGERTRFKAGESTIFIVNLREQTTADTAGKEIEALQEYHVAEANLRAALGEW